MPSCKHCGQEIEAGTKQCPHCKHNIKQPIVKKWWFWLILIGVVILIGAAALGSGSDTAPGESGSSSVSEDAKDQTKEDQNVPTEYRSALKKAKSYSDSMHMSKAGIYNQLTSENGEKFSAEAAQYAVDHVKADWNANALEKAKNYSETMHLSKAGIYDQLISEHGEKFEKEEAQYAVDHLEADYNANALAKAKAYQDMAMSPSAIYDQLISEYGEKFTESEAQYAIDHLE